MMPKFNEGKKRYSSNYYDNVMWKLLENEMNYIFSSAANDSSYPYIKNEPIEEWLSRLLKYSITSRFFLFSGLTGSGKSTIMHHVFYEGKDFITPTILNQTLIIPMDFDPIKEKMIDNKQIEKYYDTLFVNQISTAIVDIQKTYNLPEINDSEFVESCLSSSIGLINHLKYGKRRKNEAIRKEFHREHPLYAMLTELYILLNHNSCSINNVLLIVDNIESLGVYGTNIHVPLVSAHKIINYLCNKAVCPNGKPKWTPSILICCRHYIYRIMQSRGCEDGSIAQIFESYTLPERMDLTNPASLELIVDSRIEKILNSLTPADSKKKTALSVLREMIKDILAECCLDNNDIILDLNLSNIRASLSTLKMILCNKRWIQKPGVDENGQFTIENKNQFYLKLPYILRVLGMGSNDFYSSDGNIIPNVLQNTPSNEINVFLLYSLKYFMGIASSWETPIDLSSFRTEISTIFKNKTVIKSFENAIWLLLRYRYLLRSSDQEQKDLASITKNTYRRIESVYISQAARDLWKLLGVNSILFEMMLDDIYFKELPASFLYENRDTRRLFNKIPFELCVTYLVKIIEKEKHIIQEAINAGKEKVFINMFGTEMISMQLYLGLKNSFDIFFREDRPEETSFVSNCQKNLSLIEKSIVEIQKTLEKIILDE